jgi:hypothetical protein
MPIEEDIPRFSLKRKPVTPFNLSSFASMKRQQSNGSGKEEEESVLVDEEVEEVIEEPLRSKRVTRSSGDIDEESKLIEMLRREHIEVSRDEAKKYLDQNNGHLITAATRLDADKKAERSKKVNPRTTSRPTGRKKNINL